MRWECHGHLMMDGEDFKAARERHRHGVDETRLRQELSALRDAGVEYFREGGDAWGVGERGREIAAEYRIMLTTPIYAIHKKGRYGGIVGRGWETLDEAEQLIYEAKERGADFIKFMFSGIITFDRYGELSCPSLERREIAALIRMAHEAGLSVMTHVNGAEAVLSAAECGVDSVEHGYFTDEKCLDVMAEHGTVWVPTLAAIDGFIGREGFSSAVTEETLRRQQEAVRRAAEKGVMIACGSDSGAVGVPHGAGTLREEELLSAVIDESVWQRGSEEIVRRFRRK